MRPQPFLKWWPGEKVIERVLTILPNEFHNYHETFLGADLFFSLPPGPQQRQRKYYLSDLDPEVGRVYSCLQLHAEELITEVEKLFKERESGSAEDHYYLIRNSDRDAEFDRMSPVEKAARTIYLNQTSLNNAYRKNSKGYFTPPFGKRSIPSLSTENLRACAKALQKATLSVGKFGLVDQTAKAGDLVFFNPPPIPFVNVSHYTGRHKFGPQDQEELRDLCDRLTEKGVHIVMCNSSAVEVFDLYQEYRIHAITEEDPKELVTQVIISNANILKKCCSC